MSLKIVESIVTYSCYVVTYEIIDELLLFGSEMVHLCESRHSFIVLYYYHDHVYHDYLQQHIA